jgi:HAD superfamily hydrolase (TIGR01509 family)
MTDYQAVIFDMDGTLIQQAIDFLSLRAELGVPDGTGILEHLATMTPADREAGLAKLVDRETAAAQRADLMPGADAVLAAIREAGLKTALLTRNGPDAAGIVLSRFDLPFDLVWTRDQGPIKPEPDGVLRACKTLGVEPTRTVSVGDFYYDIQAANATGAVSVLLVVGERPAWADEADHVIDALPQLLEILEL